MSAFSAVTDPGGRWDGQSVSLTWENDAVAQTDRHYTQGARIAWWSADDQLPGFLKSFSKFVPTLGMTQEAEKWGLAASQEIYTPDDLMATQLLPNDRPYAGWLYGSLGLQRRGPVSSQWMAMETFRLDVGVIGPESLAEETQTTWHGTKPRGWDNQLKFEPGLLLSYDRKYIWSARSQDGFWGLDFIPHFGFDLGNIATYLEAGPIVRFGMNIPNEFLTGARTEKKWGAYVFAAPNGRLVARNIFLDGNTFVHSHRVHKQPVVGDFKVGLVLLFKRVEISLSETWVTQEFRGQNGLDSYGSATVTIKF